MLGGLARITEKDVEILEIPGDYWEGGGQILRIALSLSVITHRAVRIFNIRAKRPHPGLAPQHFYTILALKNISQGEIEGFSLGSQEIRFFPGQIKSQNLNIDIKTSGSIGLVLQSLIPVGGFAPDGITATIKGGTSGKGAIPIEYYLGVILPILARMGVEVKLDLLKRGYYPKGGGQVKVSINPIQKLMPLELIQQGNITKIEGISHAHQDLAKQRVSERQKEKAEEILTERFSCPMEITTEYTSTFSLGSGIVLWLKTDGGAILGADAIGEKGKPAEKVAEAVACKLIEEADSGAAVDSHLADNLILYLALASGKIKVASLTLHTQTNIWVCEQFFGKIFKVENNLISVEEVKNEDKRYRDKNNSSRYY